ncbi:response regulator [Parasphingorhabdus sp. DH2-15]|uniref:response regulator n=1 Tax=Parasphingorhabdus sp. DH2-15 TaxID=3444112 RepID=UPI003F6896ED
MTDFPHLLLVDDDDDLRDSVNEYLSGQGFRVTMAENAAMARSLVRTQQFDLALLDVMMPGEDGLSLCRFLAEQGAMPIIMLTARGDATDRIIGLEIGADDYLPKPFDPRELVARIKTVLRRFTRSGGHADQGQVDGYMFEGWLLDSNKRRLKDPEGVNVPITSAEYKLLEVLASRPRQVMDRDQLLDMVHGREAQLFDRAIDNLVSRLRKKMEQDARQPDLIQTVRGGGYMLAAHVRVIASETSL